MSTSVKTVIMVVGFVLFTLGCGGPDLEIPEDPEPHPNTHPGRVGTPTKGPLKPGDVK